MTYHGLEYQRAAIRTPDRQQAGSTNRRRRFERPQGGPEGARRAAPSNPLCGTTTDVRSTAPTVPLLYRTLTP